jgi:hypothetical protein
MIYDYPKEGVDMRYRLLSDEFFNMSTTTM